MGTSPDSIISNFIISLKGAGVKALVKKNQPQLP
jgi:hypothetical protein